MATDPQSPPVQDPWTRDPWAVPQHFQALLNDSITRVTLSTVSHSLQTNIFLQHAFFNKDTGLVDIPLCLFRKLLVDAGLIPLHTSFSYNLGLHLTVWPADRADTTPGLDDKDTFHSVHEAHSVSSPTDSVQPVSPPGSTESNPPRSNKRENDPNQIPVTLDSFLDALVFSAYYYGALPAVAAADLSNPTASDTDGPTPSAEQLREHVIHFANTLLMRAASSDPPDSTSETLATRAIVSPIATATPESTSSASPTLPGSPGSPPEPDTPSVAYRTPATHVRPMRGAVTPASRFLSTPMASLFFTPMSRLPPLSSAGSSAPSSQLRTPGSIPTPASIVDPHTPASAISAKTSRLATPTTVTSSHMSKIPSPPTRTSRSPKGARISLHNTRSPVASLTSSSSLSSGATRSARQTASTAAVGATTAVATVSTPQLHASRPPRQASIGSAAVPNAPTPPASPRSQSPNEEAALHQTPVRGGAAFSQTILSPVLRDPVVEPGAGSALVSGGSQHAGRQHQRALSFVERARSVGELGLSPCVGYEVEDAEREKSHVVLDDDSVYEEEDDDSPMSATHGSIVNDVRCQAVLAGDIGRPVDVDECALARSEAGQLEDDGPDVGTEGDSPEVEKEKIITTPRKTGLRYVDGWDELHQLNDINAPLLRNSEDTSPSIRMYVCAREIGADSDDALTVGRDAERVCASPRTKSVPLRSDQAKEADALSNSAGTGPDTTAHAPTIDGTATAGTTAADGVSAEARNTPTSISSTRPTDDVTTTTTTASAATISTMIGSGQAAGTRPTQRSAKKGSIAARADHHTDPDMDSGDELRNPATGQLYDTSFEENSDAFANTLKDCGLWSSPTSSPAPIPRFLNGTLRGTRMEYTSRLATPHSRITTARRTSSLVGVGSAAGAPPLRRRAIDTDSYSPIYGGGASPLRPPRASARVEPNLAGASATPAGGSRSPASWSSGSDVGVVAGLGVVRKQAAWPSALRGRRASPGAIGGRAGGGDLAGGRGGARRVLRTVAEIGSVVQGEGAESATASAAGVDAATREELRVAAEKARAGFDEIVKLLREQGETGRAIRAEVAGVRGEAVRARRRASTDWVDALLTVVVGLVALLAVVAWHSSNRGFAYV